MPSKCLCGKASDPLGKRSAGNAFVHVIKAMPLEGKGFWLNQFMQFGNLPEIVILNLFHLW
jgi:hypothetical protein